MFDNFSVLLVGDFDDVFTSNLIRNTFNSHVVFFHFTIVMIDLQILQQLVIDTVMMEFDFLTDRWEYRYYQWFEFVISY